MIYGLDLDGSRITAEPKGRAFCPLCESPLIAKCGKIKIWHWAHESDQCDTFYEPETEWHRQWKKEFPPECEEIVVEKFGVRHKADIFIKGTVIEFQNSPISVGEIHDREIFYRDMVWVFNLAEAYEKERLKIKTKHGLIYFTWKRARQTLYEAHKPLYFDLDGKSILQVKRMVPSVPGGDPVYKDGVGWISPGSEPCWGTGTLLSRSEFIFRISR